MKILIIFLLFITTSTFQPYLPSPVYDNEKIKAFIGEEYTKANDFEINIDNPQEQQPRDKSIGSFSNSFGENDLYKSQIGLSRQKEADSPKPVYQLTLFGKDKRSVNIFIVGEIKDLKKSYAFPSKEIYFIYRINKVLFNSVSGEIFIEKECNRITCEIKFTIKNLKSMNGNYHIQTKSGIIETSIESM